MQTPIEPTEEQKRRARIRWHMQWVYRAKHDMAYLEYEQQQIEEDEAWAREQIVHCGSLAPEASTHQDHDYDYDYSQEAVY